MRNPSILPEVNIVTIFGDPMIPKLTQGPTLSNEFSDSRGGLTGREIKSLIFTLENRGPRAVRVMVIPPG